MKRFLPALLLAALPATVFAANLAGQIGAPPSSSSAAAPAVSSPARAQARTPRAARPARPMAMTPRPGATAPTTPRAYKDITTYNVRVNATEGRALVKAGYAVNIVRGKFGASTHVSNAGFSSDTVVVVAQGSAYKGKKVKVGYDTFQDAAIVYIKKNSGMLHEGAFNVVGKPGESVRLFEMRIQDTTPGNQVGLSELAAPNGGFWGGDPHWRNMSVQIAPSPATGTATSISGYMRDQSSPSFPGYPAYPAQTTWQTGTLEFHDTGAAYSGK